MASLTKKIDATVQDSAEDRVIHAFSEWKENMESRINF
jgi:hypothetical protein